MKRESLILLLGMTIAACSGGGEGTVAQPTAFGTEPKGSNEVEFVGATTPAVTGSDPGANDADNGPEPQVLGYEGTCDGLEDNCTACLCRATVEQASDIGNACQAACAQKTGSL